LWDRILQQAHKELATALIDGNIADAQKILSEFGVNKVSIGISLSGNNPSTYLSALSILNEFNLARKIWKNNCELPDTVLSYPRDIGKISGISNKEDFTILPAYRLHYFSQKIKRLFEVIGDENNNLVLEIGGGFGGIAYHLFKDTNFDSCYLNIDIPEIAVISSYFLMMAFPEKKVLLYGEADKLTEEIIKEYDIIILPNFALPELPGNIADVAFNSHSLTEMNYSTVDEYLTQLARTTKHYFLHANHEYEHEYYTPDGKKKKHVNLKNYGLKDSDLFSQLYRIPEFIQSTGNQYETDSYYEYLLKRK
jgi:putative sugar O-methyltransferase